MRPKTEKALPGAAGTDLGALSPFPIFPGGELEREAGF